MADAWTLSPSPTGGAVPARQLVVRRIGVGDVKAALLMGWRDFLQTPTHLVFLAAIYPIIGFFLARAASGGQLLPLLWPLVAGFALVGPVAALGIYELSRRRERGEPVSALNALDVFRSPSIGPILVLGIVLLAVFVAWIATARALSLSTIGAAGTDSVSALLRVTFGTAEGVRLLLIGNLVGFLFAVAVLAATVVSFPLLLDRNVGLPQAVATSIRVVLRNPAPMALWGLVVAVLLFLGSLPAFIGLAVVLPMLGHATWHLYRRVVA